MNGDDEQARARVLARVMREVQHLPIPPRRPRWGLWLAGSGVLYASALGVMVRFHTVVYAFWQFLLATVWVDGAEWAAEHPGQFVDATLAAMVVIGAAVVIRTRGQSRG